MRVGVVEIGTYTAELLIADVSRRDMEVRVDRRHRASTITDLGRDVARLRRLDDKALGRTVSVLAGYARAMSHHGCETAVAVVGIPVATASKGAELIRRAEAALGVRPVAVDESEEAALTFRGSSFDLAADPPLLALDVRSDTTRLAFGKVDPEYQVRLAIGSRLISERRLARVPVASGAVAAARSDVADHFDDVVLSESPATVIGLGEILRTLAAAALGEATVRHGTELPIETVTSMIGVLATMRTDEIARLHGISAERAGRMLGGAIIVEQALVCARATEVVVSSGGLIDGLALELVEAL